jgi:hypothetical protein
MANDRAEYVDEDAEPGTLDPWKLSPLGLPASPPVAAPMFKGCIDNFRPFPLPPSCTGAWLPMGVASDNFGALFLEAKFKRGTSAGGCAS